MLSNQRSKKSIGNLIKGPRKALTSKIYFSSGIDIPLCEDDLDRCPEVNRIVPVMLGIYILFTQILMFNLLIAMFR